MRWRQFTACLIAEAALLTYGGIVDATPPAYRRAMPSRVAAPRQYRGNPVARTNQPRLSPQNPAFGRRVAVVARPAHRQTLRGAQSQTVLRVPARRNSAYVNRQAAAAGTTRTPNGGPLVVNRPATPLPQAVQQSPSTSAPNPGKLQRLEASVRRQHESVRPDRAPIPALRPVLPRPDRASDLAVPQRPLVLRLPRPLPEDSKRPEHSRHPQYPAEDPRHEPFLRTPGGVVLQSHPSAAAKTQRLDQRHDGRKDDQQHDDVDVGMVAEGLGMATEGTSWESTGSLAGSAIDAAAWAAEHEGPYRGAILQGDENWPDAVNAADQYATESAVGYVISNFVAIGVDAIFGTLAVPAWMLQNIVQMPNDQGSPSQTEINARDSWEAWANGHLADGGLGGEPEGDQPPRWTDYWQMVDQYSEHHRRGGRAGYRRPPIMGASSPDRGWGAQAGMPGRGDYRADNDPDESSSDSIWGTPSHDGADDARPDNGDDRGGTASDGNSDPPDEPSGGEHDDQDEQDDDADQDDDDDAGGGDADADDADADAEEDSGDSGDDDDSGSSDSDVGLSTSVELLPPDPETSGRSGGRGSDTGAYVPAPMPDGRSSLQREHDRRAGIGNSPLPKGTAPDDSEQPQFDRAGASGSTNNSQDDLGDDVRGDVNQGVGGEGPSLVEQLWWAIFGTKAQPRP
ncbi:MAG: hypothetical protein DCC67_05940 [Planctomycetota bacterium]|nr:MAG: hypothetical protein DCC67_05940 [Planctomycetota bacterium]